MPVLFISDLHLTAERPRITDLFVEFLATEAADAEVLYILGDLFEHWVGDDAADLPEFAGITAALRGLTERGVPVHLMHGNRDFLIGADYARRTGCRLLADPSVIDLFGIPTLLMHGDSLCTDDTEHQAWRRQVHDPDWQKAFLARDLEERLRIARDLRRQSEQRKQEKAMALMDVNQEAVARAMREHGVHHLIHGHTHRPGRHEFSLDGKPACRIVLGDWYEQGSVLECTRERWDLKVLEVEARG